MNVSRSFLTVSPANVTLNVAVFSLEIIRTSLGIFGVIFSVAVLFELTRCKGYESRIAFIIKNIFISSIMANLPNCLMIGSHTYDVFLPNIPIFTKCILYGFKGFFFRVGSLALATSNLILSINMAFSIWFPFKYRLLCRRRKLLNCLLIWALPVVSLIIIIPKVVEARNLPNVTICLAINIGLFSTTVFGILAIFIISMLTFIILSIVLIWVFLRQRKVVVKPIEVQQEEDRKKRILRIASLITLSYMCCKMPAFFYFSMCRLIIWCPNMFTRLNITETLLILLRMSNSILDPVICCITMQNMREIIKKWFICCRVSSNVSDYNGSSTTSSRDQTIRTVSDHVNP